MRPLEFHVNRVRGDAVGRLEWKGSRFAPLPPPFRLRAVWEKAEDLVAAKPVPRKADIAEVFALAEAKPKPKTSRWVGYAARIAAGIFVVMATWYGAGAIRMERSLSVRGDGSPSIPSPPLDGPATSLSARSNAAGAPKSPSESPYQARSKGAIERVREAIAQRAAVQVTDNLREGMEGWGAAARSYPAGWSRHPDGYVQTGALALFSPTRDFTDYRLEFFGQIEKKSIGWTVRAKDEKNYHAMKFSVIEAGLRPIIAMVHYNVVDGKAGRRMQIPLNVMVHNRTPIQVAVSVMGNRFVTSIDGEEVDSYLDDTLPAGGVGFFSDAGEKARLYWVKVAKNDDWLGHICALLSGGSTATAELRPCNRPGAPAPGYPGGNAADLAGVWIALPYIGASRRMRLSKSLRYQTWNS